MSDNLSERSRFLKRVVEREIHHLSYSSGNVFASPFTEKLAEAITSPRRPRKMKPLKPWYEQIQAHQAWCDEFSISYMFSSREQVKGRQ